MAEEWKAKLGFSHVFAQAQGAYSLHCKVVDKLTKGNIIADENFEFPELKVLLENCISSSFNVSLECCMSLVLLAREGKADLDYVLTKFLNILPTASLKSNIIQGIGQLLVQQVYVIEKQGKSYQCPYGIRTHPHPFVTILTNHPSCGLFLVDQAKLLLRAGESSMPQCNSSNVFQMLKPFFLFILGDPRCIVDHSLKYTLQCMLLQSAKIEANKEGHSNEKLCGMILEFLVSIMAFYKTDIQTIELTTSLIHQVTQWVLGNMEVCAVPPLFGKNVMIKIVDQLLCLVTEKLQNGSDVTSTLLLLHCIQNRVPKVIK